MDLTSLSPDLESEKRSASYGEDVGANLAPDVLAAAALQQAGSTSPLTSLSSTPSAQAASVPKQDSQPLSQLPTISETQDGATSRAGKARITLGDPVETGEDKPAFSAEVADIISQIRAKRTVISGGTADDNSVKSGRSKARGGRRRAASVKAQMPAVVHASLALPDRIPGSVSTASTSIPAGSSRTRGSKIRAGRGRGRGRGSRSGRGASRGGNALKRKRNMDDDDDEDIDDDDDDIHEFGDDSDESEHFTPIAATSSGRKVSQVLQAAPTIKVDDQQDTVDASMLPAETPGSRGGLTPHYMSGRGRGRGRGRGKGGSGSRSGKGGRGGQVPVLKTPGATAVCKSCARGHSPASNAIVFCDICNKGWHQFCHDPPVPQAVLTSPDAPWFCADCTVLREERDRLGMMKSRTEGVGLSLSEKKKYLLGLGKDELVGMIIHACSVNPSLAIFGKEAYRVAGRLRRGDDDELLPYPKAGNGVRLKPESEDEDLLIDEDKSVYSHTYENMKDLIVEAETKLNGITRQEASVGA